MAFRSMSPESQDGTTIVQKRDVDNLTGVGVTTGRRGRDWQGDLREHICYGSKSIDGCGQESLTI